MTSSWHRTMTSLGLGALLAVGSLTTGCVVRAHGEMGAGGEVYEAQEAPPPPREETHVEMRAGYVWVRGHWARRARRWVWVGGHWRRARSGYHWQPGHWQRRGPRYVWVPGRWVAGGGVVEVRDHRTPPPRPAPVPVSDHRTHPAPAPVPVRDHRANNGRPQITGYPTQAPPPPRAEHPPKRHGYVFVRGHYKWHGGAYVWQAGHWERERPGRHWVGGHWARRGNRYVWVEGHWN